MTVKAHDLENTLTNHRRQKTAIINTLLESWNITQEEAQMRKSLLTKEDGTYNVKYDLVLTIRRSTDKLENEKHDFEGLLNATFDYYPKTDIKDPFLFLNFVGEIHYLEYNGTKTDNFTSFLPVWMSSTCSFLANCSGLLGLC